MGNIVVNRDRIDDAAASKGQSLLLLEIGDILGQAVTQRMIAAIEETGIEQARNISRRYRGIGDPASVCCNFDQRLEIQQTARSGADDRDVDAEALGFAGNGTA